MKDIILKIKKKWQTVAILIFMVVAIAFSISIFIPARYSSQIKMIIIQNHKSENVDAFSAAKSAEYLSNIIVNVVFTESFIQDMLDAPFEIKKNFFYSSEKRMKIWKKTVDVDKENNTGILTITVLDKSRAEAEKIAESIAWGLNVRGDKYHGGGDSVKIKIIDGPITSEQPATPNILLNVLLAFIIGLIGSISTVYFFDNFELVLFRKRESELDDDLENKNQSVKKIVANLEKIRGDLKNKNSNALVADEYSIEKYENKIKPLAEDQLVNELEKEKFSQPIVKVQTAILEEEFLVEESVKEIKTESSKNYSKKVEAPKNLPIFKEEEIEAEIKSVEPAIEAKVEIKKPEVESKKSNKGFITMEELNQEAEKTGLTDDEKEDATKYEASSEEVKERLNKLLRGEL